ncbi:MAG: hypothetical protein B7C24_17895, partial [Bacteroidetes bacterium 4572_77]
ASESKPDTLYSSLYLAYSYPIGINAPDFFKQYALVTSSNKHVLKPNPAIGIGYKYQVGDVSRIGIFFNWYYTRFSDSFHQKIYPNNEESPQRFLIEELEIDNKIFFLTYDYCPYIYKQFHSYIAIGAGVNYSNISWHEEIVSPLPNDLRTTGSRLDDHFFSFSSRVALGVELGWDKRNASSILGDLILEAAYTAEWRYITMFRDFEDQFIEPPSYTKNKYRVIPHYFTLSLAVSLNLMQVL